MAQLRFLVADGEYIIAMEAERILRELLPCEVAIVNPAALEAQADTAWEGLALALLDTGFQLVEEVAGLAGLLRQRGVPVVFTTANAAFLRGVPGFPEVPVLGKPFDPARFAEVILPLVGATRGAEA
ncbi:conserved hypothetical protein [uncultured Alphaproteobacteria bacterium]|uniref:Response regulatory domain-containing protein n=1 Tax=uncultured Alphaproteobacteria bacterium TaxID=91750 RepID=A0A212KCG5_9PROT|nr:conserved hypothetical protein [uncultured Alphaproteobacteria bacterium]